MPKNKTRLPDRFDTIDQIQDFWDTHSSADFWDEMTDVDMELSPELREKIELNRLYRLLGLEDKQIHKIEQKAQTAHLPTRQLISRWVLEHV